MRRLVLVVGLFGVMLATALVGPAGVLAVGPLAAVSGGASAITQTSASVAGTVLPVSATTTYRFDYGTTSTYGQMTAPTIVAGMLPLPLVPVSVSASLAGLSPATIYHYRVTATDGATTSTGTDQTFTTAAATPLPTAAVTGPATAVSATSATLAGTVNPAGAPTIASFQYGVTVGYGQVTPPQAAGSGRADVPISAAVTGLSPATLYHYRVTATAGSQTTPGGDRTFVTPGTPAASVLTVTVNPAGGDTDLATSLSIGSDPAGTPRGQASAIAEALAPQFINQLASFGVCTASQFNNPQGPTAANCPDRSAIIGSGTLVTRDQAGTQVASDQGVLVKTGLNTLIFWWHTPATGAVAAGFGQAPGVVTQETGAFGPVVTYAFATLPSGARVKQLALDYQRNAVNSKAPFAAATCVGGVWQFQARIVYLGGVAAELPTTSAACGEAPQPSKLALARATINGRTIDILAPISRRASGNVSLELYSAGQHTRWTAAINSTDGRIRDTHVLPASQANNGGTGILTIRYAGNAVTRPQVVRLRAANVHAVLDASRPTLDAAGRLHAQGTISAQARGVVRVQLEYYSGGQTTTLERFARISNGAWNLDVTLTAAQQAAVSARRGTVESYILFTGYFPIRMRGEMIAYQVLGGSGGG